MQNMPPEAFRFAVEHTVDSVVITDMDSVIRYVNRAFTTVTGFSAEDAIGRKPSILRSRHTTADTYAEMWAKILAGGWWHGELINAKKTGEEWHADVSISQIKDEEGRPFAYIGISRDISELKRLQFLLKEASLEAIFMLSVAAEAKDEVTGSHIQRIQRYSLALARRLGFPEVTAEEIGYSSMMHDIGKMHIPDAILQKAGPLSRGEWDVMARHPENGVAILRDKAFYALARDIAGNHHEKWNGSGYPTGKKGAAIPLASRIVTVVDVFDALTTPRPYKRAWSDEEALAEIVKQRGRAFDPDVVDAFVSLYEQGVVTRIREEFPTPVSA